MIVFKRFFLILSLILIPYSPIIHKIVASHEFPVESISLNEETPPVHIEILKENESIEPGLPFSLLLHFKIADKWHTYGENPGDSGMPAHIDWTLPAGFTVNAIHWPQSKALNPESTSFGYEKEFYVLVDVTAAKSLNENALMDIGATVNWLACSDSMCLPGNSEIATKLTIKNEKPRVSLAARDFESLRQKILEASDNKLTAFLTKPEIDKQATSSLENPIAPPSEFEGHFLMALFFGFIGGMLLNLMPCVLPVLSLKVFSFIKMSGESRKLCFQHGLSFSAGVLVSFWALAGMLLILQAYGQSVGWGFQLQEPIFVAILASIIFILGLNLFGVMELGHGITSVAGNISHKASDLSGSFLSGVLATAIATPCTGPFLGSAVGYAVTLPAFSALLIFTMLGMGMAFPYLLLSAYPSLLRFVPKPGRWMVTFKEIMGFLMMATTIWLLFVFAAQTSSLSLIILLMAFLLFTVSCWIYGRWASPLRKKKTRRIGSLISVLFLVIGAFAIFTAANDSLVDNSSAVENQIASDWEPFSKTRLLELQAQGVPVFVDFTAKWCLICQTNHLALTTTKAENKFESSGVVKMKADWTKNDPAITAELKKFGRNSVPLYVLYGKDSSEKPQVLPQVLTPDLVINYLEKMSP